MNEHFRRFAHRVSVALGSVWAFVVALAIVFLWAMLGPTAGFSQTWQLVINTSTTIVTFLMVFIIQNTQNRDNRAIQLKLDELIEAVDKARNTLVDLEDAPDKELVILEREFASERGRGSGSRAAQERQG